MLFRSQARKKRKVIEDVEDTLEKDIEGDREAGDCGGEDESEDVTDKSVCSKNELKFTIRYYNQR